MDRLPLKWFVLDRLEVLVRVLWPARLHPINGWLFLAPALLLVGVLLIGLGYMIEYSLHELDLSTYRLKEAYSLSNYLLLAEQPVYLRILLRTVLAAVLVTLFTLFLAFPYAYVMVRTSSSMFRKFLLMSLFLPFFIGQVVRAYGWLIILGKQGILNSLMVTMGLPALDLIYNYGAVLFGLVQYMLPFAVLLIVPAITAISEDIELAAESLGANWPRIFWYVVLPMARPGLIGSGIVVFTLTLTDFAMPEILGGGTSDFIASAIYDSFSSCPIPAWAQPCPLCWYRLAVCWLPWSSTSRGLARSAFGVRHHEAAARQAAGAGISGDLQPGNPEPADDHHHRCILHSG